MLEATEAPPEVVDEAIDVLNMWSRIERSSGTHAGQGGPCPPTGKSVSTDYVYVMDFEGDKIRHMTKIWHSGLALKALGWM